MMEVKVNVEINISESTRAWIAALTGAPVVVRIPTDAKAITPAYEAEGRSIAEPEPAKKKPAAKKPTIEDAKAVIKPKEEPAPAEPAPVKEAAEEKVDFAEKRKQIKAFCASRKAEGVNIPKLVHDFLGTAGAKFSQIPDERLDEFAEIVKAAEVE